MQLQSLTIEFILLQISVAFSPGLIIALVVNEAVQKGRKNALQVAYGAATGAIGITLITAAVITYIFSLIPEILTFIYIFGIIYIVYKGIKTIQDKGGGPEAIGSASFLSGFNAKFIIPDDSSNTSTFIKTCFSPKSLINSFNSFKSIP